MIKLTKRVSIIREKISKTKNYNINEAIFLLKEMASTNFIESVDTAINLDIDVRKPEQNVYGTVLLPYGIGRPVRVAVFTHGSNAEIAKEAGAEVISTEILTKDIKKGKVNFDVIIASPDVMQIVSKFSSILGPRGLMPNPKLGTVTSNIAEAIKDAQAGKIYYRNDRSGIIHTVIGKVNFENYKLKENLQTLLVYIKKTKPVQIKGSYIKKVTISSTMGVGITIDLTSLNNFTN